MMGRFLVLIAMQVLMTSPCTGQKFYVLEKASDRLVLNVAVQNIRGTLDVTNEYLITQDQAVINDAFILRESYFISDQFIMVSGKCLVNISDLLNRKSATKCLDGQPNFSLGKISPTTHVFLIDSSRFEGKTRMFPYTWNIVDDNLLPLGGITIAPDIKSWKTSKKHMPVNLAVVNYSFVDYSEPTGVTLQVANLRQKIIRPVDSVNFTLNGGSAVFFRSSFHWLDKHTITYLTGNTTGDGFQSVAIWKYSLKTKFCTNVLTWNPPSTEIQRTDAYRHHLYKKTVILVEDHRIRIFSGGYSKVVYQNDFMGNGLIIDAIRVD
jgi:hypothetical protein